MDMTNAKSVLKILLVQVIIAVALVHVYTLYAWCGAPATCPVSGAEGMAGGMGHCANSLGGAICLALLIGFIAEFSYSAFNALMLKGYGTKDFMINFFAGLPGWAIMGAVIYACHPVCHCIGKTAGM